MENKKLKVYFANGLFSDAERNYNSKVVNELRQSLGSFIEIFLPQEAPINDKSTYADSVMIAQLDTEKLLEADILVAVLDGVTIDAGVASEIGAFYTTGKPIIGLYTDVRRHGADNVMKLNALKEVAESQFHYLNLYTVGLVKKNGVIVTNTKDLATSIREIISLSKLCDKLNSTYGFEDTPHDKELKLKTFAVNDLKGAFNPYLLPVIRHVHNAVINFDPPQEEEEVKVTVVKNRPVRPSEIVIHEGANFLNGLKDVFSNRSKEKEVK